METNMAKTTILDLLFAKNAPSVFHRPLVAISIIICGIWSVFFVSEVGDFIDLYPSEWLTYFIRDSPDGFSQALPNSV